MSDLPRDHDTSSSLESLKGIEGFYVLTAAGELGVYEEDRRFRVDSLLTGTFKDYLQRFLGGYCKDPEQQGVRLAVVLRNAGKHPWSSASMVLEDGTIQELYPVWGARRGELTLFQRRSKVRSIYQGMELLLEYRGEALPDTPVFCPVLFDRHTTVASYPALGDTGCDPDERVAEVLNLLARLDVGTRQSRSVRELIHTMHAGVIRKERRRTSDFTLVDEPHRPAVDATDEAADPAPGPSASLRAPPAATAPAAVADAHSPHPPAGLLGRFARLDGLDDAALTRLGGQVVIETAPPGRLLVERGTSDSWLRFLVSGSVELEAEDGGRKVIEGGTDDARYPLGNLLPYKYTVRALTPVKYLRLDRTATDAWSDTAGDPAPPATAHNAPPHRVPAHGPSASATLDGADAGGQPTLPALPTPLAALCRLVEREAVTVEALSEIALADLRMERALLSVAQQGRGGGADGGETRTCLDAVSQLGTANAARIMLVVGFAPVFRVDDPAMGVRAQAHWDESLRIACIAFVLGSMALKFSPERCFLAALVHAIGEVGALKATGVGNEPRAETRVDSRLAGHRAGGSILRSWAMSPAIVSCAVDAQDWYRDPEPEPDYCDLVMVARLHATIGSHGEADAPRMDELPAYRKLAPGGELTPRLSLQILRKAKELQDEARRALAA